MSALKINLHNQTDQLIRLSSSFKNGRRLGTDPPSAIEPGKTLFFFAEGDPESMEWATCMVFNYQSDEVMVNIDVAGELHHEKCSISTDGESHNLHVRYEPETLYHFVNVNIDLSAN